MQRLWTHRNLRECSCVPTLPHAAPRCVGVGERCGVMQQVVQRAYRCACGHGGVWSPGLLHFHTPTLYLRAAGGGPAHAWHRSRFQLNHPLANNPGLLGLLRGFPQLGIHRRAAQQALALAHSSFLQGGHDLTPCIKPLIPSAAKFITSITQSHGWNESLHVGRHVDPDAS